VNPLKHTDPASRHGPNPTALTRILLVLSGRESDPRSDSRDPACQEQLPVALLGSGQPKYWNAPDVVVIVCACPVHP
jgi:hypothetical protein